MNQIKRIVKHPLFYLLSIVLIAILIRVLNLSFPFGDFDEGTYIATVRSFIHGHPLLSETYLSQFPLFIYILSAIYWISPTIWALRLFPIVCSLCIICCVFLLVRRKIGFLPAVIVSLYLTFDTSFLVVSRTIQADIPWVCFTTISFFLLIWYERKRNLYLVILAGISFGVSILIKANGIFLLVFLFYILLQTRLSWKQKLRNSLIFFIPSIILFFAFIPLDQITILYHEAIKVRFSYWGINNNTFHDPVRRQYILDEWPFLFLALCSTYVVLFKAFRVKQLQMYFLEILTIFWYWLTFIIFIFYNPLFAHHFVFLIVPQAILASFLFKEICTKSAINAILLGFVFIAISSRGIQAVVFPKITTYESYLLQVSQYIDKTTKPTDIIVADEPILLYLSNRDTIPQYVDLSYVRIQSAQLQPETFLFLVLRLPAKEVILASGRLQTLPKVPTVLHALYQEKQFGTIKVFTSPY